MKKKLFLVILLTVLLLCLFAGIASAASYDVWVCGEQVTDANKGDILGDGTLSYIPATGQNCARLVMNNAHVIFDPEENYGSNLWNNSAVYTAEELVIEVTGKCSVSGPAVSGTKSSNGIAGKNPLYICGSGVGDAELTVSGADMVVGGMPSSYGICMYNQQSLTVSGSVTVSAIGGDAGLASGDYGTSCGLYVQGNVTVTDGARLSAVSGNAKRDTDGIVCLKTLNVTDGAELNASAGESDDGCSYGLELGASSRIHVENAVVKAQGRDRGIFDNGAEFSIVNGEMSAGPDWDSLSVCAIGPSAASCVEIYAHLYDVWVNGIRFSMKNFSGITCGEGLAAYDPESNTVSFTGNAAVAKAVEGNDGRFYGILSEYEADLNLVLENGLKIEPADVGASVLEDSSAVYCAIGASGKVSVGGNGDFSFVVSEDHACDICACSVPLTVSLGSEDKAGSVNMDVSGSIGCLLADDVSITVSGAVSLKAPSGMAVKGTLSAKAGQNITVEGFKNGTAILGNAVLETPEEVSINGTIGDVSHIADLKVKNASNVVVRYSGNDRLVSGNAEVTATGTVTVSAPSGIAVAGRTSITAKGSIAVNGKATGPAVLGDITLSTPKNVTIAGSIGDASHSARLTLTQVYYFDAVYTGTDSFIYADTEISANGNVRMAAASAKICSGALAITAKDNITVNGKEDGVAVLGSLTLSTPKNVSIKGSIGDASHNSGLAVTQVHDFTASYTGTGSFVGVDTEITANGSVTISAVNGKVSSGALTVTAGDSITLNGKEDGAVVLGDLTLSTPENVSIKGSIGDASHSAGLTLAQVNDFTASYTGTGSFVGVDTEITANGSVTISAVNGKVSSGALTVTAGDSITLNGKEDGAVVLGDLTLSTPENVSIKGSIGDASHSAGLTLARVNDFTATYTGTGSFIGVDTEITVKGNVTINTSNGMAVKGKLSVVAGNSISIVGNITGTAVMGDTRLEFTKENGGYTSFCGSIGDASHKANLTVPKASYFSATYKGEGCLVSGNAEITSTGPVFLTAESFGTSAVAGGTLTVNAGSNVSVNGNKAGTAVMGNTRITVAKGKNAPVTLYGGIGNASHKASLIVQNASTISASYKGEDCLVSGNAELTSSGPVLLYAEDYETSVIAGGMLTVNAGSNININGNKAGTAVRGNTVLNIAEENAAPVYVYGGIGDASHKADLTVLNASYFSATYKGKDCLVSGNAEITSTGPVSFTAESFETSVVAGGTLTANAGGNVNINGNKAGTAVMGNTRIIIPEGKASPVYVYGGIGNAGHKADLTVSNASYFSASYKGEGCLVSGEAEITSTGPVFLYAESYESSVVVGGKLTVSASSSIAVSGNKAGKAVSGDAVLGSSEAITVAGQISGDLTLNEFLTVELTADSGAVGGTVTYPDEDKYALVIYGQSEETTGKAEYRPDNSVFRNPYVKMTGAAVITEIQVFGTTPVVVGNSREMPELSVPEGAHYRITSSGCNVVTSSYPSDTFVAGQTYEYYAFLAIDEGYTVMRSSDLVAKIDGYPAKVSFDGLSVCIYADFYCEPVGTIDNVQLDGVSFLPGDTFEKAAVPEGAHYSVVDSFVSVKLGESAYSGMGSDTYHARKTYRCEVGIVAEDGYLFSDDLTVKIGSEIAALAEKYSDNYLKYYVEKVCEPLETVSSVQVNGISVTAGGSVPALTELSLPDGVLYSIKSISWRNVTANCDVAASERFKMCNTYRCMVTLEPKLHYAFDEGSKMTGKLDDVEAAVSEMNDDIVLAVDYYCEPLGIIGSIQINGITLTAGGYPVALADLSVPEGAYYAVESILWTDAGTGNAVTGSETFKAGRTYRCAVTVGAAENYLFDESSKITGKMGETAASVSEMNGSVVLTADIYCEPLGTVSEIQVSGITVTAGCIPSALSDLSVPEGSNCSIESVRWTDISTGSTMTGSKTFKAGKTYRCAVTVGAAENYLLDESSKITGKLGEAAASVTGKNSSVVLTADFYCEPLGTVTGIQVSGITVAAGGSPAALSDLSVPEGAYYAIESILWTDVGTGNVMTGSKTFRAGKTYRCAVTVGAAENYVFDEVSKITGKLGGTAASVTEKNGSVVLTADIYCEPLGTVTGIQVSGIAVTAGGSPAALSDLSVSEGAYYAVESILWTDVGTGNTMSGSEPFRAGRNYRCEVTVGVAENYVFDEISKITGKLGSTAASVTEKNGSVVLTADIYCEPLGTVTGIQVSGIQVVVGNEAPMLADISVPAGAAYYPVSLKWTDMETNATYTGTGFTFRDKVTYRCDVELMPEVNYLFGNVTGKIGSDTAQVNKLADNDVILTVYYSPSFSGALTITGTERYRETLTAHLKHDNAYVTLYSWYREDKLVQSGTSATYTLTLQDVGKVITCQAKVYTAEVTPTLVARTGVIKGVVGPDAPVLTAHPATNAADSDGSIEVKSGTYPLELSASESFDTVIKTISSGDFKAVPAGTYYVRTAPYAWRDASEAVCVTVGDHTAALYIEPVTVPFVGVASDSYIFDISVKGGTAPYTWEIENQPFFQDAGDPDKRYEMTAAINSGYPGATASVYGLVPSSGYSNLGRMTVKVTDGAGDVAWGTVTFEGYDAVDKRVSSYSVELETYREGFNGKKYTFGYAPLTEPEQVIVLMTNNNSDENYTIDLSEVRLYNANEQTADLFDIYLDPYYTSDKLGRFESVPVYITPKAGLEADSSYGYCSYPVDLRLDIGGKPCAVSAIETFCFNVYPEDISKAELLPVGAQPFQGKAVTPDILLHIGSLLLSDENYTVEWSNNEKIGTAGYTITGRKNLTGQISGTFDIIGQIGDVNADGKVDLTDVSLLFRWWNGKAELTQEAIECGDFNGDKTTDLRDAAAIFRKISE